jgi:hypothetical protein
LIVNTLLGKFIPVLLSSTVELSLGLIACSLPALNSLLLRFLPNLKSPKKSFAQLRSAAWGRGRGRGHGTNESTINQQRPQQLNDMKYETNKLKPRAEVLAEISVSFDSTQGLPTDLEKSFDSYSAAQEPFQLMDHPHDQKGFTRSRSDETPILDSEISSVDLVIQRH